MKNRNISVKTGDKAGEELEHSLFKAILKLRNIDECKKFFKDILTVQELSSLALRWQIANMLDDGYTYVEIEKATGASSTTIARINRWLEYGEGGYKIALKRTKKQRK